MYQIGDVVMYGMTGACRVEGITEQSLPGTTNEQLYYTLTPVYQSQCTIRTPVDNKKVAIRSVISRDEAERLIDMIPSMQPDPCVDKANSELMEHYMSMLKAHNCGELIELTMSIYAKKRELEGSKRKFGVVDERFLRQAEDLLFGELAVALDVPKGEVPSYIASRVEATDYMRGGEQ